MTERLAIVSDEFARALGRQDDELNSARETALQYAKGVMTDVPSLPNRSKAVSTDVADQVETALPDLIEIFTGEDIATFAPIGQEDEEAAQQETDYVQHVFFNENPGFLVLYSAFKDALLVKTGIIKVRGEDYEEPAEDFQGQSVGQWASASQRYGERVEIKAVVPDDSGLPENALVDFCIRKQKQWKACVEAVPPEDFGVSKDTIKLSESPYCFHRTRVRAYELVKRGISRDKVDALPAYGAVDNQVKQARERTGETVDDKGGLGDHRLVEVVEHYLDGPDGRYRILTDASALTMLEEEEHPGVPFAALTPYLVPHQFFGESVADKLVEIQRIKTALTRMALDSGYFALNQRPYVDMNQASEWTIPDLLRNEPGMPIRGKGVNAVTYMGAPGLSFDAFGALEYFSVASEVRTGIVRNAQGLNPDTLHDTATGAMALMSAAQKRVRLIARVFAETGLKDAFLILHRLLRENSTQAAKVRLKNKWVEIDPTSWGSRSDMTIEIGVGSAGKEAEQMRLQQGLATLQEVVAMQGGVNGPLVTLDNVHAFLKRYFEKGLDFKSADPFLTDPADNEGQPPEPPPPDPAMLEMQAKLQQRQAEIEGNQQIAQAKAQSDMEMLRLVATEKATLAREEAQERASLRRDENSEAMAAKRETAQFELQHRREVADVELQLRAREIEIEAELKMAAIRMNAEAASQKVSGVAMGGEPG